MAGTEQAKTYWLVDVRAFCQKVFGSPIVPQTFSEWRKRMKVKQHAQQCSEIEAQMLIKYAELRREHGYYFKEANGKQRVIDRALVMRELAISIKDPRWLAAIQSNLETVKESPSVYLPEPTYGRDLPKLIKQVKGRTYSIRSMYRLFERFNRSFDLNRKYRPEVVQFVLDYFDRPRQKPVRQSFTGGSSKAA